MRAQKENYYAELKMLCYSDYKPEVRYLGLQQDIDMEAEGKVARLSKIKLQMYEISLHL